MNRKADELDYDKGDNKVEKRLKIRRGTEDLPVGMGEAVDDLAFTLQFELWVMRGFESMEKTMD
ncbi:hypothetical protein BOTCAL_0224g00100 [Botryotinia calthae]|uniref:Uncharacterized protein n=1 Tax=Botryotinia calthae TaxID=38488 RepID=A0A4Y8CXZ7_9HELO|nr:hypothetical protein BOTCAL_0224g00100 [Botryotinia calthae]